MKDFGKTSEATTRAFERLAELGAKHGVISSAMFGMPALKAAGKAFAGVAGDGMAFKLEGAAHARALALAGAELFDPSGAGRPMKQWVLVPQKHHKDWPALAEAARIAVSAAVEKAPAKPAKKKASPKRR